MRWKIAIIVALVIGLSVRVTLLMQMPDLPPAATSTAIAVVVAAAVLVILRLRRHFETRDHQSHHP
jgi:hypothetical protein